MSASLQRCLSAYACRNDSAMIDSTHVCPLLEWGITRKECKLQSCIKYIAGSMLVYPLKITNYNYPKNSMCRIAVILKDLCMKD